VAAHERPSDTAARSERDDDDDGGGDDDDVDEYGSFDPDLLAALQMHTRAHRLRCSNMAARGRVSLLRGLFHCSVAADATSLRRRVHDVVLLLCATPHDAASEGASVVAAVVARCAAVVAMHGVSSFSGRLHALLAEVLTSRDCVLRYDSCVPVRAPLVLCGGKQVRDVTVCFGAARSTLPQRLSSPKWCWTLVMDVVVLSL
jgi:hypothetical protein